MLTDRDKRLALPQGLEELQAMSDAVPAGVRWSVEALSPGWATAVSTPAPGLTLTVQPNGVAHLEGPAVPSGILRLLHQEALILHQLLNGRVVLHGSAVVIDGVAVATIGPSGAGKSTTAAALLRHGAGLLSDDVVVIDDANGRLMALPTESRLRLKAGATASGVPVETKSSDAGAAFEPKADAGATPSAAPAELRLILALTCGTANATLQWSHLRGLAALDAIREYGAGQRGLDVQGPALFLQRLARVANGVQVWRLNRTATARTPDDLAAEVIRLVRGMKQQPRG